MRKKGKIKHNIWNAKRVKSDHRGKKTERLENMRMIQSCLWTLNGRASYLINALEHLHLLCPSFIASLSDGFLQLWGREGGAERSPLRMNAIQLTTEDSLYDTFLLIFHWVRYTPLQHQAFYLFELTGKHWSNMRVKSVLLNCLIQNRNLTSLY